MSAYEPPTEIDPIFNSLAFQGPNEASLTIAEADERYLARQNVATSVASATSFSAEVAATSFKSLDSGATNFHLDNLAGNDASLVIRNQRTNHNLFYRQFGTTNSHVFTTNGTGTTNLTMSNTENICHLPLNMSSQAISNTTQINSTNSGSLGLVVQNLSINTGGLVVRNNNTASDLVVDCAGSARTLSLRIANTPQVSITSTTTSFAGDIVLRTTQPTNTTGYLGYTVKQNATNTAAITTSVAYNLNSTGLSLTPGVYIFHIMVNNSKLAAGSGDIGVIQVGISTGSGSFVGGATTLIKGQQTYAASGAAQDVIGNGSFTFSVPTTATYYLLQQSVHTLGANLIGTTNSYWQYTRVA